MFGGLFYSLCASVESLFVLLRLHRVVIFLVASFFTFLCVLQEPEMRPSFAALGTNLELITDT